MNNVSLTCVDKELSIDIPPESPLSSSKRSKKRKAKDGGGSKDKKQKRSKSKPAAKGDKVAEISYEDASEGDDEPPDVCSFMSYDELLGFLFLVFHYFLFRCCVLDEAGHSISF